MVIAWRAYSYGDRVDRVEFERETEHFYFYKSGRRVKKGGWELLFPSEQAALDWIAARKESAAKAAAEQRIRNAAPDLLEALVRLSADEWLDDGDPRLDEARAMARAAIAKATGEQP